MNLLNCCRCLSVSSTKYPVLNIIQNNFPILSAKTVNFVGKHHYTNNSNKNSNDWIQNLDEQTKSKIQYIQNEITLLELQNPRVPKPEWISKAEYIELLQMSIGRRRRYYSYLYGKYQKQYNDETKKFIRKTLRAENEENNSNLMEKQSKPDHIQYGLGANSLMTRITEKHIAKWKNRNLVRAYYQNEPPLVFDCEFVDTMNKIETESAVREIAYSFKNLREHKTPFVMHLCNLEEGTYFWNRLMNGMKGLQKLPIIISPKDITELYPSATDNLIYLTPDAERVLHKIEPNHGYIIGAIVDKGDKKPYTLAKAKKLNIQTARLPIEGFVKFRAQKALPFDQVTNILLEAKVSNDWKKAFSHIARRKLM